MARSDTTPTVQWPVRVDATGAIATAPQGGVLAVQQAVGRIAATELGELDQIAPWMGLPPLEGRALPPDADAIVRLIAQQEPAAAVTVRRAPDPSQGQGWERLSLIVGLAENTDG